LDYKNALQTGDKLVLYYVSSSTNSQIYQTGPYTAANSITFSKADLEAAAPIAAKKITVPAANTYVYVQAYLEYANGQRVNVTSPYNNNYTWSYSPGISAIDYYYFGVSYIYYAAFNN
jgi:hypothetical protein